MKLVKLKTITGIMKSWFLKYDNSLKDFEKNPEYINYLQEDSPLISKFVFSLNLVKPHSCVLSIGCGAGREVKFLVCKLNCKVTAIDHSEIMLELSKEYEPNAEYILGTMQTMNLNKKFDYITCIWNTINFLPGCESRKQLIKNCYEHLNYGGQLIITSAHKYMNWRTFGHSIINKGDYYYSPKQVEEWFVGVNFKIQKMRLDDEILILATKEENKNVMAKRP